MTARDKPGRTKIYLSGPMRGIEGFNYPAFNAAAEDLRRCGFDVLNPAESFGSKTDLAMATYMRKDIGDLLTVDAVVVLPGWEKSQGACLEVRVALALGLVVWAYRAHSKTMALATIPASLRDHTGRDCPESGVPAETKPPTKSASTGLVLSKSTGAGQVIDSATNKPYAWSRVATEWMDGTTVTEYRPVAHGNAVSEHDGQAPWDKAAAAVVEKASIGKETAQAIADYLKPPPKAKPAPNVLQEADALIHGDRQTSYGHPSRDFSDTAKFWSTYKGVEFTPYDVAWMMILLKISRSKNGWKRDNLVDCAGYAGCLEMLHDSIEKEAVAP